MGLRQDLESAYQNLKFDFILYYCKHDNTARRIWDSIPGNKKIIFSTGSRKNLATTKSLIQRVMRQNGWGVETDHLPPSDAKMKNE